MPTPNYQRQDAVNVLYNSNTTPITADGNSAEIDFSVIGGFMTSEVALRLADMEGTGTITFVIQDYINGSFVDTPYQFVLPATANGNYIWPIDNRMVTGTKFRLKHDITAGTDADGIQLHAHLRPSSMHRAA